MASNKTQALISLLLLSLSAIISSSHASAATTAGIAIYWGQDGREGDLRDACKTGHYKIVLLAFLNTFGQGRTEAVDFTGHCSDIQIKKCKELQSEIEECQKLHIKVLLSLGGDASSYGLSSADDAKKLANYLYKNFLSDQPGPVGKVKLDGIDFDIERGDQYWDNLAYELDALRQPNKKFYLSAAPQCPCPPRWPIYYLEKAIKTGVFDFVFVQFYNNPDCSYAKGLDALTRSWDEWVKQLKPNNTLFLGLPASPSGAGSGYIPTDVMIDKVLPYVKKTANYGGVMLWKRYFDLPPADYSGKILDHVTKSSVALEYAAAAYEAMI